MQKTLLALAILVLGLFSCKNGPETDQKNKAAGIEKYTFYGDTFKVATPMTIKDAVAKLKAGELQPVKGIENTDKQGISIQLAGTVSSVCQMKGCWMNLASESPDTIFVRFKDYGFFVPKDLSNKKAVIKGNLYQDITPVEELRHYAEDKGATPAEIEKIKEPKVEYMFYASGVAVPQ